MLILHLWRLLRARASRWAHARKARAALARLDRRTLADIGVDRGAIAWLAREVGVDRLRRPPHL
jgi:uncharacterized protein YjiS (DUF1127 family)